MAKTVFSGKSINVVVDYYWDSHGNLVEFPYRGSYQDEYQEVDVVIEDTSIGWTLKVNGEEMAPIVYSYGTDDEGTLWIDGVIGWG